MKAFQRFIYAIASYLCGSCVFSPWGKIILNFFFTVCSTITASFYHKKQLSTVVVAVVMQGCYSLRCPRKHSFPSPPPNKKKTIALKNLALIFFKLLAKRKMQLFMILIYTMSERYDKQKSQKAIQTLYAFLSVSWGKLLVFCKEHWWSSNKLVIRRWIKSPISSP